MLFIFQGRLINQLRKFSNIKNTKLINKNSHPFFLQEISLQSFGQLIFTRNNIFRALQIALVRHFKIKHIRAN